MGRSTLGWDVSRWDGTFHVGMGRFTLGWDVSRWDGTFHVGMVGLPLGRGWWDKLVLSPCGVLVKSYLNYLGHVSDL